MQSRSSKHSRTNPTLRRAAWCVKAPPPVARSTNGRRSRQRLLCEAKAMAPARWRLSKTKKWRFPPTAQAGPRGARIGRVRCSWAGVERMALAGCAQHGTYIESSRLQLRSMASLSCGSPRSCRGCSPVGGGSGCGLKTTTLARVPPMSMESAVEPCSVRRARICNALRRPIGVAASRVLVGCRQQPKRYNAALV